MEIVLSFFIFYFTHPLTLFEVLKSPGFPVNKKVIPEGKYGNSSAPCTSISKKRIASLLL